MADTLSAPAMRKGWWTVNCYMCGGKPGKHLSGCLEHPTNAEMRKKLFKTPSPDRCSMCLLMRSECGCMRTNTLRDWVASEPVVSSAGDEAIKWHWENDNRYTCSFNYKNAYWEGVTYKTDPSTTVLIIARNGNMVKLANFSLYAYAMDEFSRFYLENRDQTEQFFENMRWMMRDDKIPANGWEPSASQSKA